MHIFRFPCSSFSFNVLFLNISLFSLLQLSCEKPSDSVNIKQLPEKNILSAQWAAFLARNPGGKIGLSESDQTHHREKANELMLKGYEQYREKNDENALKFFENSLEHHANGEIYYHFANSLSNTGHLEDALKSYEIAGILGYKRPELVLYNTACVYSRLKNAEKAYEFLAAAVDRGYNAFQYIENDPDMEFLRSQPDWKGKITALIPVDVKLNVSSVSGHLQLPGPRLDNIFILCPSGKYINNGDVIPSDGSCCEAEVSGRWELINGDLFITKEKICESLGVGPVRPGGCGGACCIHESCGPVKCSSVRGKNTFLLQKSELKNAIAGKPTSEQGEYWNIKFQSYKAESQIFEKCKNL